LNIRITIIILFLALVTCRSYAQTDTDTNFIIELISKSRDKTIDKNQRDSYLTQAQNLVKNIAVDSTKNRLYYKLSYAFFQNRDSINFRNFNKKGISLSNKLRDSILLANHYWDLGAFYSLYKRNDSAYFFYNSAKKILDLKTPGDVNVGKLLLFMATIQKDVKDYTGSELKTIEAIKIFDPLNDYKQLYNCYNNLGIVFNNLEEYDQAIGYHNEALKNLQKVSDKSVKEAISLNNLGIVYRNKNNHEKAIKNYLKALENDSIIFKRPRLYAILLDNLAYSKFKLNDFEELPELFFKALKIRDSINIPEGIVINKLHLAEYFWYKKDTLKSFTYASEAKNLAKKIKSYEHLLDSYKILATINPSKDSLYLNSYIHTSDSLVKHERSIRNKFARIQFETDEYISQNHRLNLQNTWIVAISTAIIFFGFLIYIITQQRTRNKELEMERQQQRANEEIYNLMIDQQDKIEEGRKREKERISLELHDGILGRLFGTRLSLGSLNAKDDLSSKKMREQYIYELQSIEEEVRNISHELGLDNFNSTTSYSTMIANLLQEQSKITNFKYQIEDDDRIIWTDIPGHIKINIYRIIQESIQNINKYAQAENVILDFKKNGEHIILTIKDDGVGFDQEKRNSGIGLKNMKSRVALLHGQFTINSIPGKGTSISVDVPMT